MCGITGIFSFGRRRDADPRVLAAMTQRLHHRGPDDAACVLFDPGTPASALFRDDPNQVPPAFEPAAVGLGHRRLSILDLSPAGRQPMTEDSGRFWVVLNGEIYNYRELASELRQHGSVFRTTSDTEVLLHAYRTWGDGCFARLNGMWALAIYDQADHRLVLSRDRFGKKPLYYAQDGERVVFASEPKALFCHPRVVKRPNLRKCALYAGRNYRDVDTDDETFFEGLRHVPAGSVWTLTSDGADAPRRYWTLAPRAAVTLPTREADVIALFRDVLEDAVGLRLRSDVPVGTMLSGGLDSTTITALARRQSDQIQAFSAVTGEGYYDESSYIREVVDFTSVRHAFVYPQAADLVPTLRQMIAFHDEPICTVTWFSLFLIANEIARAGIKVVLTGHGGDELLAGYWDHYHYFWHDLRQAGVDPTDEIRKWQDNHGRDPVEVVRSRQYVERNAADRRVEASRYTQYLDALRPDLRAVAPAPPPDCPYPGELNRRLYLELLRETVPPVLRAEDRNLMIHAVENRCPFLDYRLADLCFAVPEDLKIRDGLGKYLLRESARGLLPERVRTRTDKTGHNAPADLWWRGDHRGTLEALLEVTGFVNECLYDRARVRAILDEHLRGANHAMFLWQYLNMHVWHETLFELRGA
jgi:asparagine synthase (glutamine-hydrolysing)